MAKIWTCLLVLLLAGNGAAMAQQQVGDSDTMWMVYLDPVKVTTERQWANDTVRYRYNQMKYYVKTILPYLNEATKLFAELDAKINQPGLSKKDRREFVNTREGILKNKFEKEIKALNETQGVLLVKLIGRQTGVNIYSMLQEFKNPFTAIKWQTWAKINGFNLNKRYDPNDEPTLEHIMESLGYPLPEKIYGRKDDVTLSGGS
jgi:hypothetical protein